MRYFQIYLFNVRNNTNIDVCEKTAAGIREKDGSNKAKRLP